jgi:hypothetical protein
MNSISKKGALSKCSPERSNNSNKAKSTAVINKMMNVCSKSTEKFMDLSEMGVLSSLKKSELSNIINQNLGSLIFETPPKGK